MRMSFSWLDVKLAVRMLIKFPGLTAVSVCAMAVAIAVCAAFFEFTHDLSSATLPLDEGERLVGVVNWNVAVNEPERRSAADYFIWRNELTAVEDLGAYATVDRNLITADNSSEPVKVAEISAVGFRVARVPPLLGRTLESDDERLAAVPVVVIGYEIWQSRFGGDPSILGRDVKLGGETHTIVGVMPEGFGFPVSHRLWVPLKLQEPGIARFQGPSLQFFGRLAPGVGFGEAQAQLSAIASRMPRSASEPALQPRLTPYIESFLDEEASLVWRLYLFQSFLVLILIVCCINVAALMFARTVTRAGEIAVRTALGASRGRIVAQLFLEALALAVLAAIVGLTAADTAIRLAMHLMFGTAGNGTPPFWWDNSLSIDTVAYTIGLALLGAVVAGVIPAVKGTGKASQAALPLAGTRSATLRFGVVWTVVIATQVALSVALLPMALSEGWDAIRVQAGASGFPAHEYLSAHLAIDEVRHGTFDELERRLSDESGVVSVTFADPLPGMDHPRRGLTIENVDGGTPRGVHAASVSPGFFAALGTPIIAGRAFHSGDAAAAQPVALVNESFVRHVLGGRNPIGQRVRLLEANGGEPGPWREVVGVVPDLGMSPMDPDDGAGVYQPLALDGATRVRVAIRLRGDPASFAPRLRAIAAVDPTIRLYDPMPLDTVGESDQAGMRMLGIVLALIAGVALLLSTVGIYSLMSFTVSQRTREIGIRIALGARPRRIVAAIFSRAFAQVGLGALAGVALLLLADTEESSNLALLAAVAVLMMGVGLAACGVPALRALRIQPTEALKDS